MTVRKTITYASRWAWASNTCPLPPTKKSPIPGLPMAGIRDTIVSVLTDCKADAPLTHDGKLPLKKNLLAGSGHESLGRPRWR